MPNKCPNCGGETKVEGECYVVCTKCFMRGPRSASYDEQSRGKTDHVDAVNAVKMWNKFCEKIK